MTTRYIGSGGWVCVESGETVTSEVGIGIKKSLKIPTGQSESVYRNLALVELDVLLGINYLSYA